MRTVDHRLSSGYQHHANVGQHSRRASWKSPLNCTYSFSFLPFLCFLSLTLSSLFFHLAIFHFSHHRSHSVSFSSDFIQIIRTRLILKTDLMLLDPITGQRYLCEFWKLNISRWWRVVTETSLKLYKIPWRVLSSSVSFFRRIFLETL